MLTLGIVFGGESCEHDVSVITALTAYNMLKSRYMTYLVYMKEGAFWTGEALKNVDFYKKFDSAKLNEVHFTRGLMAVKKRFGYKYFKLNCVLNCAHGGAGEDGSLSGYFETVGVPYTCSGVFGSALCMDKVFTKIMLEKFKFPVVSYRIYRKGYRLEKMEELGYPLIIKPAHLGSSVGIAYAETREELERGLEYSLKFDRKLLVEKALQGFEEYNCAVCENDGKIIVSEVEHPTFDGEYWNFSEKYLNASNQKREIPALIDEKLTEKIKRLAREVYLLFELKGPVRVDFLCEDGKLYLNEINTVPGALACYLFKGEKGTDIVSYAVDGAIEDFRRDRELVRDFSSDVLKNYKGSTKKIGKLK